MSEPAIDRRRFLQVGIGGIGTAAVAIAAGELFAGRHRVHIAGAPGYGADLRAILRDGLRETGQLELFRGKRVLLKPNLLEPAPHSEHINTHPSLVVAAAEVARELGARDVIVAEATALHRDVEMLLEESGLGAALRRHNLRFVDLNHDAVQPVENRGKYTGLRELVLPRTLLEADVVVSLAKLKTHHWAGVTLSMKNCFGMMPGLVYGWPKNTFHCRGIDPSILDIVATIRPQLAIVDGIVAMEGDGPIMGTPKPLGVVVVGANLPAVDATCARLMGIDPRRVRYLEACPSRLGRIEERWIDQTGEPITRFAARFAPPPDLGVTQALACGGDATPRAMDRA